jgi:hypothetical protein
MTLPTLTSTRADCTTTSRLFSAFRNDTPNYLKQAEALSYAIRAAIDNELEQKDCMLYRAARGTKSASKPPTRYSPANRNR